MEGRGGGSSLDGDGIVLGVSKQPERAALAMAHR